VSGPDARDRGQVLARHEAGSMARQPFSDEDCRHMARALALAERGLCTTTPNTTGCGIWIVAWMPPEIQVTWLISHSMMNCAASVAIARYSPLMRSEGKPTITPTSAVTTPPAGMPTQNGAPYTVPSFAAV